MHDLQLATALDLALDDVDLEVRRPGDVFGSPFRVTEAATSCAAAFVASVADLEAQRTEAPVRASVDGLHAAVSFHSERLITAERVPRDLWAPLSGNYAAADGWVRIHAKLPEASARSCVDARSGASTPTTCSCATVPSWSAHPSTRVRPLPGAPEVTSTVCASSTARA